MPRCAPPRNCSTDCWTCRGWMRAAARRDQRLRRRRSCCSELAAQYAPLAAGADCTCACMRLLVPVRSDRRLLRRVLQNFIATRCATPPAGAWCWAAAAAAGAAWSSQVWDTGPGIRRTPPAPDLRRVPPLSQPARRGASRAWAWACRSASASRACWATPCTPAFGAGPRQRASACACRAAPRARRRRRARQRPPAASIAGLRVLCVDNDREILDGMRALLGRWGVRPLLAGDRGRGAARWPATRPDVMLVDYHLHDRVDGLDALDAAARALRRKPAARRADHGRRIRCAGGRGAATRLRAAAQAGASGGAAGTAGGARRDAALRRRRRPG